MLGTSHQNLMHRVLFTLFALFIYRLGSYIPIPGVDVVALEHFAALNQSGVLGMFNMLSGGSLGRMSIFALAIMPYITASIIVQLMSIVHPPLENLKKEGAAGRQKINQFSRYLTVFLASVQAYSIAVGLISTETYYGPVVIIDFAFFKMSTVITLAVGTIFLMWVGEQISAKGIGNGTSLIIFIGIISNLPSSVISVLELVRKGAMSPVLMLLIFICIILLILLIVYVERAQRKVLVQYPTRQMNNKLYSSDTTHIPLKLNTSGVIPPIFASAVLLFPTTISNFTGKGSDLMGLVSVYLGHGKPLFMLLYVVFIVFFSFFYTAIVFNTEDTANNLRKNNAYVLGVRPGKKTAEYFDYVLTRITVLGSIYLSTICIVPEIALSKYSFALGGTGFLIIVNVIIDTFSQIQNHLFNTQYSTLVKKMRLKSR